MGIYVASEAHAESEHDDKVKEVESFHSPLKDVTFYSSCFKGGAHRSFMIIHAHSMDEAKSGVPEGIRDSVVEVDEMEWGPEGK
ncbi:MAG TPA: hypothetical protein VLE91_00020 [Candidatus Saccharimonadales bacterium]|nr:hypothetical protein [Candidatus Saccharimonadales bacterium]